MIIENLFVYPIKSCGGIELAELELSLKGPLYDRMFTLVDDEGKFLSQRVLPKMALIKTYIGDCPIPTIGKKAVSIDAPGMETHYIPLSYGEEIMHDDFRERGIVIHKSVCRGIDLGNEYAEWFSTFLNHRCRLIRQVSRLSRLRNPTSVGREIEVSFADGYPLLVMTMESLGDLNRRIRGQGSNPIPINRFRPNILLRECTPYDEDQWKFIDSGGVRLEGANKCVRCVITTTDQKTAEREREPLRTLANYRRTTAGIEFGRNFVVVKEGVISRGDQVTTA